MGKGKGNFKRWCTIIYPGRIFIEHLNISPKIYAHYLNKINIKLKIQLKMLHVANKSVKKHNINDGVTSITDQFDLLRVRNSLYS